MRKSRQPLCSAAISPAAAAHTPKLLDKCRNPLRDFVGVIASPAAPIVQACRMARS
jgi:hypothetical protein